MTGKFQKILKESQKKRRKAVRLHNSGKYTYAEIGAKMTPPVSKQMVFKMLKKEGAI